MAIDDVRAEHQASISVRRKQLIASAGVRTIGSFSLSDVLSTIGTPVFAWKREINA